MTLQLPYVILDPYIEADLQYLLANSGGGGGGSSTYDIAMEFTGGPPVSTNILVFNAVRPFTLVAGLAGSYFTCQTAPSASTVFTILQNASTIGTITFASGATSGTASFTSGVTFNTGDELIIQSPSAINGLLTLAITFKGTTTTVGGASTIVVEQAGTAVVPTATTLNFTGSNVTVTNPGSGVANINITANPSITVNSTVIVGGTSGHLLYDNAGVVGELAILPVANGGTGTATPSIVAGTNISVTGTWPNQTINASGGGGGSVAVQNAGTNVVTSLATLNFVQGATVTGVSTTASVVIPQEIFGSGAPGVAGTPTLDGTATGQFTSTTSGTVTLSTTKTNDVIVLLVASEQTTLQTVSSVTSAHLTWTRRGGGNIFFAGQGCYNNLEVWWAPSTGILTSEVITVTMTGSIDDVAMAAFGVNGAANIASPWDTGTLPVVTTGSPAAAPVFSTSQAHDFIFAASSSLLFSTETSSWTSLASVTNGGGARGIAVASFYETVSATQSGVTASLTGSSGLLNVRLVDAITGDVTTTYVDGDLYFDQSTTPYIEYVYKSGAWHQVGAGPVGLNTQTGTAYTLVLGDGQNMVTMNNASANTVTVPLNASVAFPIGTTVAIQQLGAGKTTVAATGGVTLNYLSTLTLAIVGQYGVAQLIKTGTDTWTLFGAIGG